MPVNPRHRHKAAATIAGCPVCASLLQPADLKRAGHSNAVNLAPGTGFLPRDKAVMRLRNVSVCHGFDKAMAGGIQAVGHSEDSMQERRCPRA